MYNSQKVRLTNFSSHPSYNLQAGLAITGHPILEISWSKSAVSSNIVDTIRNTLLWNRIHVCRTASLYTRLRIEGTKNAHPKEETAMNWMSYSPENKHIFSFSADRNISLEHYMVQINLRILNLVSLNTQSPCLRLGKSRDVWPQRWWNW